MASLTDQSLWKKSFPAEVNVREWVQQKKDEANAFAQKCMVDTGFEM
jgi:hypothetical protein